MNAGYGLSVRWSLEDAPQDVAPKLRDYVVGTSMARFMFLDGLAFKTWRMVEGQWFEGTYVFDQAVYRDDFAAEFTGTAETAPGSAIIGSRADLDRGVRGGGHRRGAGQVPPGPRPGHRLTVSA